MDLWSDPNLTSYMAVTAHWMEGIEQQSNSGIHYSLRLRSNLIGFLRLPGRHTGNHLAAAFLFILERLNIVEKVFYYVYICYTTNYIVI